MRQLKCHRCGSAELVLHEVYHTHGTYDGGLFINDQDHIEARGDGTFSQGEIQPALTRIECESCGYEWHPRRWFDGSKEPDNANA